MIRNFKGFGDSPSNGSPYGFTKEKELLCQFINQGDAPNLYRLAEALVDLYGEQLMIRLLTSIAEKLQPETLGWLRKAFALEADRARFEYSVTPESDARPVWQHKIDSATGDLLRQGYLEIVGWDGDFIIRATEKGRKHLSALKGAK